VAGRARLALLALAALLAIAGLAGCTNDIVPAGGWSGPIESGGFLYFGSSEGQLRRVDSATGQLDQAWAYPPGEDRLGAIYGSPVAQDDVIYAAGYSCRGNVCTAEVFALDAGTGLPAWGEGGYTVSSKVVGQVALGTGTLVFGTSAIGKEHEPAGYLYALDPTRDDGNRPLAERVAARLKWRLPVEGAVVGGVTVHNDVAYFGTMGRRFYAVDLRDNSEYEGAPDSRVLWSFETEGAVAGGATVTGGTVVFGDFQSRVYGLNTEARQSGLTGPVNSGRGEWTADVGGWVWATPVAEGDVVYAATLGGQVHALRSGDGSKLWAAPGEVDGQVIGALALMDTNRGRAVAAASSNGNVGVLDTRNGIVLGELFTEQPVKSGPLVFGEFVFVNGLKGEFYTFSTRSFEQRSCIDTRDQGKRCAS
jgi:outer membrane protein assembly factor BamB